MKYKKGAVTRTILVILILIASLTLVFYVGKIQENKKITGYSIKNESNETELQQSPFTEKTYSLTSYLVYIFLFSTISVLIVSLLVRIFIPKLKNYT